jgi:hypothetical protein
MPGTIEITRQKGKKVPIKNRLGIVTSKAVSAGAKKKFL